MEDGYELGYWNGLQTKVRKVTGKIVKYDSDKHPNSAWWRGLSGERIDAVEVCLDGVNYGGGTTYLAEGHGDDPWFKVTKGYGSPALGHHTIPLEDVRPRV